MNSVFSPPVEQDSATELWKWRSCACARPHTGRLVAANSGNRHQKMICDSSVRGSSATEFRSSHLISCSQPVDHGRIEVTAPSRTQGKGNITPDLDVLLSAPRRVTKIRLMQGLPLPSKSGSSALFLHRIDLVNRADDREGPL